MKMDNQNRNQNQSQYHCQNQNQYEYGYGTFQGVANYYHPPQPQPQPQPHSVIGFPQPVPPPAHSYHTGYVGIVEGTPIAVRQRPLPCCGLGLGWFLFVIGFFLGGIPWYAGTFLLLCTHLDTREKPGYVACAIASFLAVIAVTMGATKGSHIHHW